MTGARVLLVRHGRTDDNDDKGRYADNPEGSPLNATGRAQAARVARFMQAAGFTPAVTLASSVPRAAETARLLLEQSGNTAEVQRLPELGPQRWGNMEVPRRRELMRTWGYAHGVLDSRFPGGESGWEVYARVLPAAELLRSLACKHSWRVLVVSHGLVLRLLIAHLLGHDQHAIEAGTNLAPGCGAVLSADPSGRLGWILSVWTPQRPE